MGGGRSRWKLKRDRNSLLLSGSAAFCGAFLVSPSSVPTLVHVSFEVLPLFCIGLGFMVQAAFPLQQKFWEGWPVQTTTAAPAMHACVPPVPPSLVMRSASVLIIRLGFQQFLFCSCYAGIVWPSQVEYLPVLRACASPSPQAQSLTPSPLNPKPKDQV